VVKIVTPLKILLEITLNGQGYLNPFYFIDPFLATPKLHIISSPDTYQQWATNISCQVSCYCAEGDF